MARMQITPIRVILVALLIAAVLLTRSAGSVSTVNAASPQSRAQFVCPAWGGCNSTGLAIWTDQSDYGMGEGVTICYTVPDPGYFAIFLIRPDGGTVVQEGQDDGTGGCFIGGTTAPPPGPRTLTIYFGQSVAVGAASSLGAAQSDAIDSASTTYSVHGQSGPACAPMCPADIAAYLVTGQTATEQSSFFVGDQIVVCYEVQSPGNVLVTQDGAGTNSQLANDDVQDQSPHCTDPAPAAGPAGQRNLHLRETNNGQLIAQAQSTYTIQNKQLQIPGGMWITPDDGATTTGNFHFAAHAYPASGNPPVKQVDFTVKMPNGSWQAPCSLTSPTHEDVYECDVHLAQLGVPPGQVMVSFNVYDSQYDPQHPENGHYNDAPNGTRIVNFISPPTPTPTPRPIPQKVIVFVGGLSTHIDAVTTPSGDACPSPRGDETFAALQEALASARVGDCQHYLFYSYKGGSVDASGAWQANPYNCYDTGDHVAYSAGLLVSMLKNYYQQHPNVQFNLVGHSLGGLLILEAISQIEVQHDLPLDAIASVVTIDSPLKHASNRNLSAIIALVDKIKNAAGAKRKWAEQVLDSVTGCLKVLYASDAARDIGNITDSATRQSFSDQAENIVKMARGQGVRFLTTGNQDDCLWHPTNCSVPGNWDVDTGTMIIAAANDSYLPSLGIGGCLFSTNKHPALRILCIFDINGSHGRALRDGSVAQHVVSLIGKGP